VKIRTHKPTRAPGRRHEPKRAGRFKRAVYDSARWSKLRELVLGAEPICSTSGCFRSATELDHVKPIDQGGDVWDRANLQGLCARHHGQKTRGER